MIGIYIRTSPSSKKYVGKSVNIEARLEGHRKHTVKVDTKHGRALRKYKFDDWQTEIIEAPVEFLDMWEKFYIHFHDSFHNGYNGTEGGDGISNMSQEIKDKIAKTIRETGSSRGANNGMFGREGKFKGQTRPEHEKIKMRKPRTVPRSKEHCAKMAMHKGKTWKIDPTSGKRCWIEIEQVTG